MKTKPILLDCFLATLRARLHCVAAIVICVAGFDPRLATLHAQGSSINVFTYQGRLSDTNGPVTGLFDFSFSLYDSSFSTTQIGTSVIRPFHGVTNGLFTIPLDFPGSVNLFAGPDRWLEISVKPSGGLPTDVITVLSPRQQLTAAPYAIRAATANSAIMAEVVTGGVSAGQIVGTLGAASLDPSIGLWTTSGSSVFRPTGGVGIGTANPQANLHVYSANNPTVMRLQSTGTPGFGRVEFMSNPQGDGNEWRPAYIQSTDAGGFTGGLSFVVNGTGAANKFGELETMRIQNGGVGINTNNPGGAALAVQGPVTLAALGAVVTSGVTSVLVNQTDSSVRLADARALAIFAANACGNVNPGPTCASPETIGQIGFGGSVTRSGALPAGGSAERWFSVSWNSSGGSYHPHAYLSAGATYYTIDVFLTCAGSVLAIGTANWETLSQVTLPPGTTVYVRVRPYTANPNCQAFTVVLLNG